MRHVSDEAKRGRTFAQYGCRHKKHNRVRILLPLVLCVLLVAPAVLELSTDDVAASKGTEIHIAALSGTTPTATVPAGVLTPVPLGSWSLWSDRPTDALGLENVVLQDVYFAEPGEGEERSDWGHGH